MEGRTGFIHHVCVIMYTLDGLDWSGTGGTHCFRLSVWISREREREREGERERERETEREGKREEDWIS